MREQLSAEDDVRIKGLGLGCISHRGDGIGELLQGLDGQSLQLSEVLQHLRKFFSVLKIIGLIPQVGLPFVAESKCGKHEALDRVGEVFVLRLLTIFVHDIPDNVKLNGLLEQEQIVLRVSVREQDHDRVELQ